MSIPRLHPMAIHHPSVSSAPSSSAIDGIMPGRLRSLVSAPKPEITIKLNSKRRTFTTLDKLDGSVSITAPVDTPFTDFEIEFLGTSRAYVERLTTAAAVSGRSEAFHQFLKLSQPNLPNLYPADRLLKAGHTYTFPFLFAIPERILDSHCRHKTTGDIIHELHTQLPPTLGDKDSANHPDVPDDFAPDMASVRYGVFARLTVAKPSGGDQGAVQRTAIASKARRVRVLPAAPERPPVSVDDHDEFILRKERKIKKTLLSGRSGILVAEVAQPQAMRLPSPHSAHDGRVSTVAHVNLRFDPVDDSARPPKLSSLAARLKVNTFFASTARRELPTKHAALMDLAQGVHTDAMGLSSRCVANVEWTKQHGRESTSPPSSPLERRDSGFSTGSASSIDGAPPAPSAGYKDGRPYYTAQILTPITLPEGKTFVPTFHTCLISRTYGINLSLNVHNSGIAGGMDLKVPVQISSQGSLEYGDEMRRRSSVMSTIDEEAELDEDIADFFTPRRTSGQPHFSALSSGNTASADVSSNPSPAVGRRSSAALDAPPEYTMFASSTHRPGLRVPVF